MPVRRLAQRWAGLPTRIFGTPRTGSLYSPMRMPAFQELPMPDWNPALYLRFEDERTRPALDLLGRVPLDTVVHAVDLGCGPGNSTALLARRWPDAEIVGVDTSDAMLADARKRLPSARFEKGDVV